MDNLFHQRTLVSLDHRRERNGHNSFLVLFTGLSGSGKSTIAIALEKLLYDKRIHTYLLDGDNVRLGLNNNLGFSEEDRVENLRRVGEVGKLFVDAGIVTLAAFVSPFESERQRIREIVGADNFLEIHISTPLEVCEQRDTKGLYQKAREGKIQDFTGISSPYEAPLNPLLNIDTTHRHVDDCVIEIFNAIIEKLKI